MIWYVEIRSPLGKWVPHLVHGDRPERVSQDGRRNFRHDPVPVIARLSRYPVEAISAVASPAGKLYGHVTQEQLAEFLEHPTKQLMVVTT
jgi:hypothetical protein